MQSKSKKISLAVILVVFALMGGCRGKRVSLGNIRFKNAANLSKLKIGLSKKEVLKIMGNKPTEINDRSSRLDKTFFPNPYRTETKEVENKIYEVLFYYTDKKQASRVMKIGNRSFVREDDVIADDDLTPLILYNEKLIGWGWNFFEDTTKKYELRIKER